MLIRWQDGIGQPPRYSPSNASRHRGHPIKGLWFASKYGQQALNQGVKQNQSTSGRGRVKGSGGGEGRNWGWASSGGGGKLGRKKGNRNMEKERDIWETEGKGSINIHKLPVLPKYFITSSCLMLRRLTREPPPPTQTHTCTHQKPTQIKMDLFAHHHKATLTSPHSSECWDTLEKPQTHLHTTGAYSEITKPV